MDMLDILKELLIKAPDLAIWIFLIFYGFKVVVVGSIYGVIRYCVGRIAESIEKIKTKPIATTVTLNITDRNGISRLLINDTEEQFITFMQALRNASAAKRMNFKSEYIHPEDLVYALQALHEKQERDAAQEKKS